MPIGAYGGKREIMQMISPDGPVYQAGTLSGNPIATTAGIETLKILKEDPDIYKRLEARGEKMAQAVRDAAGEHVRVNQIGSLLSVFFTKMKSETTKVPRHPTWNCMRNTSDICWITAFIRLRLSLKPCSCQMFIRKKTSKQPARL